MSELCAMFMRASRCHAFDRVISLVGRSSASEHGMSGFDSHHESTFPYVKKARRLSISQHRPWRWDCPGDNSYEVGEKVNELENIYFGGNIALPTSLQGHATLKASG